jgi:transposase
MCGKVKSEQLEWLAKNPLYTKRFAIYVGKRCRDASVQSVAKELNLDWHTVKELEKEYMRQLLEKAGSPGPQCIGIDEISVGKGHTYRIVVSDLIRRRPIWIGGKDRSESSMKEFYARCQKDQAHSPGCNGYVETVSEGNGGAGATSSYSV